MNYLMKIKKKDEIAEDFLEHKKKKTWKDAKSGKKCFMLYARSLYITWGTREYWSWNSFKDTSDENIEVAKLRSVCWLDVRGKFKISDLSPAALYEVVYEVKLTKAAAGWELPVKLRLSLPYNGKVQERQVSLLQKPRGQWMELNVGTFRTEESGNNITGGDTGETREVCFDLYEHGGHWKNGLIIKGAILRPKN